MPKWDICHGSPVLVACGKSPVKDDGVRPVRPPWRNSENPKDLVENCSAWNPYCRMWKSWKCLLDHSAAVDPKERNTFCQVCRLPTTGWAFHKVTGRHLSWCPGRPWLEVCAVWKLLLALSPGICATSVYIQRFRPMYIPYMCVVYIQIYMCMVYAVYMSYVTYFFLISLYIYIYTHIHFCFAHAVIKAYLKNVFFLLLLFHWIQPQMLDSEEEYFIKITEPVSLNSLKVKPKNSVSI